MKIKVKEFYLISNPITKGESGVITKWDIHPIDEQINEFLNNVNIEYVDVKYGISSYGYANEYANNQGTDTGALLVYKEVSEDD